MYACVCMYVVLLCALYVCMCLCRGSHVYLYLFVCVCMYSVKQSKTNQTACHNRTARLANDCVFVNGTRCAARLNSNVPLLCGITGVNLKSESKEFLTIISLSIKCAAVFPQLA